MRCNLRAASFLLLSCGLLLPGCGSQGPRLLDSITISPSPAVTDIGSIQLVATGIYSTSPKIVTPLQVNWYGPAYPGSSGSATPCAVNRCPTISSAGLLSCGTGFTGTFTVSATAPLNPQDSLTEENVPVVTGTVTATCEK